MNTPLRKAMAVLVVVGLLLLAGCGAGGKAPKYAFPSGPFTNADLSGTYVFSITGSNSYGLFTAAGSFLADGHGNVTTAVYDMNSGNGVFTNVAATGIYAMSPDGRGNLTLNSQVAQLNLDFVLASSQHGLMIRFDTVATASGTLDRQDANALAATAVHGLYVFNVSGVNASSGILAAAGVLNADGAGQITEGVLDQNDNGAVSAAMPLSGSYSMGPGGRGLMQIASGTSLWNFAFYMVDATHFKLVQVDAAMALGGEAYSHTGQIANAALFGGFAFTTSGMSTNGPDVLGGVFTADGNGNIVSGAVDENDTGTVTQNQSVTGHYAMAANGRGELTLTLPTGTANFAMYPSTNGVQIVELDSNFVTNGAAFSQAGATLSDAAVLGAYAYNMTGAISGGGMDSIAQFTAVSGGTLSGAVDYNLSGALNFGLELTGTYSVASNGRGNMILRNTTSNQNLAIYVARDRVLFVDLDRSIVGLGSFEPQ